MVNHRFLPRKLTHFRGLRTLRPNRYDIYFGWSVAISAGVIVVGVHGAEAFTDPDDISPAYVFTTADNGTSWSQPYELVGDEVWERNGQKYAAGEFGDSVAISEDGVILVGAPCESWTCGWSLMYAFAGCLPTPQPTATPTVPPTPLSTVYISPTVRADDGDAYEALSVGAIAGLTVAAVAIVAVAAGLLFVHKRKRSEPARAPDDKVVNPVARAEP